MENIGAQGFRWFVGKVEDIKDPEKNGRVKVRIFNVHSDNRAQLPTDRLPWARLMMPVTSASLNSIGVSPTGIEVDSTVIGFFLDSDECNFPVVMGTLYGTDRPNESIGISNRSGDRLEPYEPAPSIDSTPLDSIYPNNKVLKTKSGHILEFDDTPNYERINLYHKSGTYIEINNEGRLVIKSVNDSLELTTKNKIEYVKGNYTLEVKGNLSIKADGNITINGATVDINNGEKAAARVDDSVNLVTGLITSGSSTVKIGG
jgi:hypothetical protein